MTSKNGWLWSVGLSDAMGPSALMRNISATSDAQAAPQPEADKTQAPSPAAPAQDVAYAGNVKSKSFHQPGCRYYQGADCTTSFASRDEAVEAGYKPCKVCKP
ncbi:MAG: hypothetical protein K9K66_07795 [Desulfarculaceae bacterium]|nr:hypothetical protein [Desulfarculaceae bacterium]MCF8072028.1 hypothetical protein [Desulfarculaceae bacterium]MCF8101545.1 hypothetical protein [Desulfarculaceae bacterium]MCF8115095.1 hypothetical protein [Desulfarculaceae bacterium]